MLYDFKQSSCAKLPSHIVSSYTLSSLPFKLSGYTLGKFGEKVTWALGFIS